MASFRFRLFASAIVLLYFRPGHRFGARSIYRRTARVQMPHQRVADVQNIAVRGLAPNSINFRANAVHGKSVTTSNARYQALLFSPIAILIRQQASNRRLIEPDRLCFLYELSFELCIVDPREVPRTADLVPLNE